MENAKRVVYFQFLNASVFVDRTTEQGQFASLSFGPFSGSLDVVCAGCRECVIPIYEICLQDIENQAQYAVLFHLHPIMSDHSMFINIGGSIDPFFRYKMPSIQVKHEGKGNGVKTVLKNLKDVSKSLNRESGDVLQYIAAELSVLSLERNNDMIVNGTFAPQTLQEILQRFISAHVLCGICKNPETVYERIPGKSKRDEGILCKRCQACGARSPVPLHKINKRILTRSIPNKSDNS